MADISVRRARRAYIILGAPALILAIVLSYFEVNIFDELGALAVAGSVVSASTTITNNHSAILSDSEAQAGNRRKIQADVLVGVVGTIVNGFNSQIFAITNFLLEKI